MIITDMIYKHLTRPIAVLLPARKIVFTDLPEEGTLQFMQRAVDADLVEIVRTRIDIDVWVDEEFLYRKGNQPNKFATDITLALGGLTNLLHGDALLASTDDEGNTVPLNRTQLDAIGYLAALLRADIIIM